MWNRDVLVKVIIVAAALVDARVIDPYKQADNQILLTFEGTPALEWWQSASFYHIYPRSFQDSDGDGFGDLKGITSRLQHFKNTGITGAWLSPIFQSPGVDQGYDISDYRKIDKIFGTIADLKELLDEAHKLDIRIVLDFVPNHTSDQHEWFKLSENRNKGYEDYYVWRDGVPGRPPNNWISVFKGSAWTWSKKRQQYYLHQFDYRQPDLNFENPKVLEELKDILTFYMDLGVDGFRVDAVPYLREDTEFKDEPLYPGIPYDINNYDCLNHIYTKDYETTFDVIYEFREHVDAYARQRDTDIKVLMTEAYGPMEKAMLFYGTPDGRRLGAHFTFNFNLITDLTHPNFTVSDLARAISLWTSNKPSIYTSNWLLGNHDRHRVGNRLGKEKIDGLNMLIAFLPGIMNSYYGEEIGMLDGDVTCHQGWDPVATKNCSTYANRDFERTPYQWDASKNAGFSDGNYTWLPLAKGYQENNLAFQNIEGIQSHYNLYKELLKYRENFQTPAQSDKFVIFRADDSDHMVQIYRKTDGIEYTYLFNFGDKQLAYTPYGLSDYEVLLTTPNSPHRKGDIVRELALEPYECLIMRGLH